MQQPLIYAIIILSSISGFSIAAPITNNKENQRPIGMPAYILDRMVAPRFGGPVPYHVYSSYYMPVPQTIQNWSPATKYPAQTRTFGLKSANTVPVQSQATSLRVEPEWAPSEVHRTTPIVEVEVTEAPQVTTFAAPTIAPSSQSQTSQSLTSPASQTGTNLSPVRVNYHENMEPI